MNSEVTKIKQLRDVVIKLLKEFPHLRDNDEKLCATIWYNNIGGKTNTATAMEFLKMYSEGKLPSHDSISRCRRKVQEETPELRGITWVERQRKGSQVRNEINK